MFAIALLSLLICSTPYDKQPILSLSLTLSPAKQIETTFSIGRSQIKVSIDLNYAELDVCCKNTDNLPRKIYYFLINPFRHKEDYSCKAQQSGIKENDTATFEQIGPLNIYFNQVVYPQCSTGRLGFSQKSQFLALMPTREQFFIIQQQNQPMMKGYRWKLVVGGKIDNDFTYLPSPQGNDWKMQAQSIRFNQIPFNNQTVKLVSDHYRIAIPKEIYQVIQHELTTNYECMIKNNKIYCPCAGGISQSFPKFTLNLSSNYSVQILQTSYLIQDNQVCQSILEQTEGKDWQINILLLNNIDILFDYDSKRIGMAKHRKFIDKNQLINQPMQIILNCAVVLLMCFFVAMVLIQLVKYLIDIDNASNDSFETYMLKRAQ